MITLEQLEALLASNEDEHLEFKEAKTSYSFDKLVRYCAALSNEGGGHIILGVTDKRPRRVVGTNAFSQPERARAGLIERLHINIKFSLIDHAGGRVLIFHVPEHPVGNPVKAEGIYWERQGDSLVHMSEDRLRSILVEAGHDFSADICPNAVMADLDPEAVEDFRQRWIKKSGNQGLAALSVEQLLNDIEATVDGRLTYAALIL